MRPEDIRISEIQAATRIAQGRESSKVAEAYLTAIHTRNIEALGNTLHPDLHVVGLAAYHPLDDGETAAAADFHAFLKKAPRFEEAFLVTTLI